MIDARTTEARQGAIVGTGASTRVFSGLGDNLLSALRALTQNWMRSSLTMTGIVMGVLSIVTLIAIMQGVRTEVARQVEGLGANLVMIFPGKLDENGSPNPFALVGKSTLREKDTESLKKLPGVSRIAPIVIVSGNVEKNATTSATALVVGTNRVGVEMNPTPMAEGRYFDDNEKDTAICIIGEKPRRELFGTGTALGQKVKVTDKVYTIVGVLGKPKGDGTLGNAMLGLSNLVYIPFNAVRHPDGEINRIALQTDYKHPADDMIASFEKTLQENHKGRADYGVVTQKKGLALVIRLLNMAQSLLVLIAAISLFVAGVGIMNIMLVTVTERTREIGIRKTVGARNADIFFQFVTEAVILSMIGGAIGLVISTLICTLIARFSPLTPEITPSLIVVAIVVCTCVGVLFGVAPAVRASRLNPIDALRHE